MTLPNHAAQHREATRKRRMGTLRPSFRITAKTGVSCSVIHVQAANVRDLRSRSAFGVSGLHYERSSQSGSNVNARSISVASPFSVFAPLPPSSVSRPSGAPHRSLVKSVPVY